MEVSEEESERKKKGEMVGKDLKGTDKGNTTKRRINKPMIERRRRERINECLQQLYSLITELDKGKAKGNKSKLEKADILELAVDFIKRNRQISNKDAEHKDRKSESEQCYYVAGYNKCCQELTEMIDGNQNIPNEMKVKLTSHLQSCKEKSKNGSCSNLENERQKEVFKQFQTIKPKTVQENPIKEQITDQEKLCRSDVSTANQSLNGANILVCNTALPTYLLVPAATVCRTVPVVNQQQTTDNPIVGQNSWNILDFSRLNLQQAQSENCPTQFIPNVHHNSSSTQPLIVPYSTNCSVPTFSSHAPIGVPLLNSTAQSSSQSVLTLPSFQSGLELSNIPHSTSSSASQSAGTMWRPW